MVEIATDVRIGFGALEARLASMHGIANDKRTKFQARLKNLHRLGFPAGMNTVAGKATLYDAGQAAQMALAVEFMQAGFSPERLIDIFERNAHTIYMALSIAAWDIIRADPGDRGDIQAKPIFLFFDPSGLSALSDDGRDEDQASATFFAAGPEILSDNLSFWTAGFSRRLCVINVTSMMLAMVAGDESSGRQSFMAQVDRWASGMMAEGGFGLKEWLSGLLHWKRLGRKLDNVPDTLGHLELTDLIQRHSFREFEGRRLNSSEQNDDSALVFQWSPDQLVPIIAPDFSTSSVHAEVNRLIAERIADSPYSLVYVPDRSLLEEAAKADPALFVKAHEHNFTLISPQDFLLAMEASGMLATLEKERALGDGN